METKARILKNIVTSIIGVLLMAFAVYIAVIMFDRETVKTMAALDLIARVGFVAALAALGYVFLMAKDSLITGLFWGAFKVGKPNNSQN